MPFTFRNYLFSLLPDYFKEQDSYKDDNNEGLLERYLRIFGEEIDDEIYPFIETLLDVIYGGKSLTDNILIRGDDILTYGPEILTYGPPKTIRDDRFLKYIAFMLGNPIDINGMADTYRKIINYAVAIYKIKGTNRSYELLFNLLGLKVIIRESIVTEANRYDNDLQYDQQDLVFDKTCELCSTYLLIYYDKEQPECSHEQLTILDPVLVSNIQNIVAFIEPINVKLSAIVRGAYNFCENYTLSVEDVVEFTIIPPDDVCGQPFDIIIKTYLG